MTYTLYVRRIDDQIQLRWKSELYASSFHIHKTIKVGFRELKKCYIQISHLLIFNCSNLLENNINHILKSHLTV